MSEHQKGFPEFYVTSAQVCPYLPGRRERKLFTHLTTDKSAGLVDTLLKGGFRRSQSIAYMPYCDGCQACMSIRVIADAFRPTKNYKRIKTRNADVIARRIAPRPTSEQYALFRRYIDARHGDGGMADMSVLDFAMMIEDTTVDTHLVEYRIASTDAADGKPGQLIAVALSDRLSDGLSMVYSFFDPDFDRRSLGTYMILEHIERALEEGLAYVYLGYWIQGSRKMDYKRRFRPFEVLGADGWRPSTV